MIICNVRRKGGPTVLFIDAREFHRTLEALGVERGTDGFYRARPTVSTYDQNAALITRDGTAVTTNLLLKLDGPHEVELDRYYSTPPRRETLKALCESVRERAREILEHYQPIDVSITIVAAKPPTVAPEIPAPAPTPTDDIAF